MYFYVYVFVWKGDYFNTRTRHACCKISVRAADSRINGRAVLQGHSSRVGVLSRRSGRLLDHRVGSGTGHFGHSGRPKAIWFMLQVLGVIWAAPRRSVDRACLGSFYHHPLLDARREGRVTGGRDCPVAADVPGQFIGNLSGLPVTLARRCRAPRGNLAGSRAGRKPPARKLLPNFCVRMLTRGASAMSKRLSS